MKNMHYFYWITPLKRLLDGVDDMFYVEEIL